MLCQLKIMKENSDVQCKTISIQKDQISELSAKLQKFEYSSPSASSEKLNKKLEKTEEDLEDYKKLLKKYQDDIKYLKNRLAEVESAHTKCSALKAETDQLRQKLEKQEDSLKILTKQNPLNKKLENLSKDKKLLEEKLVELENDKRKLLEKWQKYSIYSSLLKSKSDDQAKIKVRELEEALNTEKSKNEKLKEKLKDLNKKFEDLKENFEREKNYSDELTSSFKSLHVQYKVLIDEKVLLDQINQELSVKFHLSHSERSSPEKQKNEYNKNLNSLQQELAKSQDLLRKKNKELIDLELKATQSTPQARSEFENINHELIYYQKYENLLEKFHKLQAEKTQIQNLYVMASSVISEKNQKVQELTNQIFEFEEKLLAGHKVYNHLKGHSISNTATSRGTFY